MTKPVAPVTSNHASMMGSQRKIQQQPEQRRVRRRAKSSSAMASSGLWLPCSLRTKIIAGRYPRPWRTRRHRGPRRSPSRAAARAGPCSVARRRAIHDGGRRIARGAEIEVDAVLARRFAPRRARASAATASMVSSETLRRSSTKRVSPAILLGPCMAGSVYSSPAVSTSPLPPPPARSHTAPCDAATRRSPPPHRAGSARSTAPEWPYSPDATGIAKSLAAADARHHGGGQAAAPPTSGPARCAAPGRRGSPPGRAAGGARGSPAGRSPARSASLRACDRCPSAASTDSAGSNRPKAPALPR